MNISAALVATLRSRTQASLMDCKRALVATAGDIEEAIQVMRKAGHAKAGAKAGRIAAEGVIEALCAADGQSAVLLEVNSETDFVAREQQFRAFAAEAAAAALRLSATLPQTGALEEALRTAMDAKRLDLVAQLGENLNIRRVAAYQAPAGGVVTSYLHGASAGGGARIGVLVGLTKGSAQTARDLAMHIAALSPEFLHSQDIPSARLEQEREIALAAFEQAGQPEAIKEKVIQGKLNKFAQGISLMEQPYVKDSAQTVQAFVKAQQADVAYFVRFEVGEGIQKKVVVFRSDVLAQVQG